MKSKSTLISCNASDTVFVEFIYIFFFTSCVAVSFNSSL